MARWRAEQRSIVAKVRVYELAKEFGVESKAVMAELEKMGEFVRSASSTIEAPVVRRLKESFSGDSAKSGRQGQRSADARPAPPPGRRDQGGPGDGRRGDRAPQRGPGGGGPVGQVPPAASPAAGSAPAATPATAPSGAPAATPGTPGVTPGTAPGAAKPMPRPAPRPVPPVPGVSAPVGHADAPGRH